MPENAKAAPADIGTSDFDNLLALVRSHLPEADLSVLQRAYDLACKAHEGQFRKSGEPYVQHPVEVAKIVAGLHMDDVSIVAALLHDTVEDTNVKLEAVSEQFGPEVGHLVGGVTKLRLNIGLDATDRQRAAAETTRAAESLRKMLLAMAQDVRVMVIKLADRLHNMRTLDALPPEKRTRIANETMDVYAPLAARLGIWQVKWQLEDLAFKALHPQEFQSISELVAKSRAQREEELLSATTLLRKMLNERGLGHAAIMSRPKHLYSIFNKMVVMGVPFEQIYDLQAMRVIVEETHECYLVLGICHELWHPMAGLFYDYIAMPKPNGYQSLHTKVLGASGEPLEIQIRTRAMHETAEYGVATHYSYKEGKSHVTSGVDQLRRQLFDWSTDNSTSSDFLRTVSTDLFSEQVFVFTPKGDVIDLPQASTPVDFAFRVHTDLGLKTIGAKINGVMVPLSSTLQNGDVVELVTRSNAQPSLDWLEFVASAHTRAKLRTYFRRRNRTESASRGKEALSKGLQNAGIDPKGVLGEDRMNELAKEFKHCENAQDVFARIGEGILSVQGAVEKISKIVREQQPSLIQKVRGSRANLTVIEGGIDNVMYRRAKCCRPIPGEDVVGFVTRGRGIIIHGRSCSNALRLQESDSERLIALNWPPDGACYPVDLRIVSLNRQGLLMDVSVILGDTKTDVSSMNISTKSNHTAEIDVTLNVRDVPHLQSVMNKIGNLTDVISILRVMGS
ncbi:MAG: bifunctional (p)ppGpp synthetase/guanosine-3',5'-bis(diphosphate) 3'-pyrophosphohydrolase [Chthonomonadaceae bacterium]|nr:bifunctional (p)ppGpp synthetase/guanosine-3',5'-bis(diphosphate) 3'-pyrophosphohydrolase [Chthonomonadaceae bacterium]